MGGNALKNCVTRRYSKQEYEDIEHDVWKKLVGSIQVRCHAIEAYHSKESFGDLDMLIMSDELPSNWVDIVVDVFQPKEWVKNGNVLSFEYKEFQIDLIATPEKEFTTSEYYFAYNDLGNLMGRLAHSMGLKLGHDGLSYNWRVDSYQFKNEVISTDWEVICNVLGLSYERYCRGFNTLEDIFQFVVASRFFNKDIYLIQNRNNYARTRDKKRKTYQEFLKWIESYKETDAQKSTAAWDKLFRTASCTKDHWLKYLFWKIPHFQSLYDNVQKEWDNEKSYKAAFNGSLVSEWTGLKGKELGEFMRELKNYEMFGKEKVLGYPKDIEDLVKFAYMMWNKEDDNE